MKRALTLAALAAAALPAAAGAGEVPPVPGGTTCTMEAKRSYRHAAVLRAGVPVRVTCNGPATLNAFLDFSGTSSAYRWTLRHLFTDSDPGMEAFTQSDVVFTEGGTRIVRLRFWPWAQRVAARFPRTRVDLSLAVKRDDGRFWSVTGRTQRARSTLVR